MWDEGSMLHQSGQRHESGKQYLLEAPGGHRLELGEDEAILLHSHQTQCGTTAVAYDAGVSIIGRGRGVITPEDT